MACFKAACENDKFQFAIQLHVRLPYIMGQWEKAVQLKFYPWYGRLLINCFVMCKDITQEIIISSTKSCASFITKTQLLIKNFITVSNNIDLWFTF